MAPRPFFRRHDGKFLVKETFIATVKVSSDGLHWLQILDWGSNKSTGARSGRLDILYIIISVNALGATCIATSFIYESRPCIIRHAQGFYM